MRGLRLAIPVSAGRMNRLLTAQKRCGNIARGAAGRLSSMMELHVCNRAGVLLRAFALGENKEVIVGRDETCDIRILAKSVSREHCAIEQDGDELILRDLGSSGGTYLDG